MRIAWNWVIEAAAVGIMRCPTCILGDAFGMSLISSFEAITKEEKIGIESLVVTDTISGAREPRDYLIRAGYLTLKSAECRQ